MITLVVSGFQSTIWFQIFGRDFFGASPLIYGPNLWLLVFLYLILNRPFFEALFQIYLFSLIVGGFSVVSVGLLWLSLLVSISFIYQVKERIFLHGARYFFGSSTLFLLIYEISQYLVSRFFEDNPQPAHIFHRLGVILLTLGFAWPMHNLMRTIDKFLRKQELESGKEVGL